MRRVGRKAFEDCAKFPLEPCNVYLTTNAEVDMCSRCIFQLRCHKYWKFLISCEGANVIQNSNKRSVIEKCKM
jgi:hypothetical protein